jgi:hypothetical protein
MAVMVSIAEQIRRNGDLLGQRLLFISTLWVALAITLLCALLPAGLPLTKSVGSAFSPSTTIVALRGRAEQVRTQTRRTLKADPGTSAETTATAPHLAFLVPSNPVAYLPPPEGGSSYDQPRYYAIVAGPVSGKPYPRGPPAA